MSTESLTSSSQAAATSAPASASPATAAAPVAAAPIATTPKEVACASCGKGNAPDSRFCRHCGAAVNASSTASNGAAKDGIAKDGAAKIATAVPVAAKDASESEEESLNPAEIDARRARQLLDRALALSDKGDKAGAILSCRQAINLAPGLVAGYAMLGPLLERNGDTAGAMAAYEKVLSLAPASPIERDSLARLRAATRGAGASRAAGLFHFDAGELFHEETTQPGAPVVTPAAADDKAPVATPAAPVRTAATPAASSPAASLPAVATAQGASAAAPSPVPAVATPPHATPVTPAPARPAPPSNPSFAVPAISATPGAAYAPAVSSSVQSNAPVVIPRWVRTLRGENSFWMQTVPLAAAALASVGFLLLARNIAASRVAQPVMVSQAPADQAPLAPDTPRNNQAPADAAPATTNTPTFPVTNDRNALVPANTPPSGDAPATANPPATTNTTSPAAGTRTQNTRAVRPTGSPRVASLPRQEPSIPPATSPFGGMRSPRIVTAPPPEPPVRAVPSAPAGGSNPAQPTGGSSSGGAPLNPAGSGTRGYIRITGNRPAAPVRPEAGSRAAEIAAREAASGGRTGNAISSASSAIEGGRDTGWRYQQRALLFLEQGDNARAADDFRTAIAAYRDQINRGVNVDQARIGIDACQNGLRLAQLRLR